jgi:hypothetical protein
VVGAAQADETLRTIRWEEEARAGRLAHGALVEEPGIEGRVLVITHAPGTPATLALATIEPTQVTADQYAIVGRVRHDDVEGEAFLRMWSHFPGGGAYFSRLAGNTGPMRVLRGSSEWRTFVLPFHLNPGTPRPERLTLELVIGGRGRVALSAVHLTQMPPDEPAGGSGGAWWSDRDGGRIGALAGGILGGFGALIGVFAALGRGRAFILGGLVLMVVLGVLSLGVAILALLRGQPYAVWYPLLLTGGLSALIGLVLRPQIARRFEDAELRRMRSLDLSR